MKKIKKIIAAALALAMTGTGTGTVFAASAAASSDMETVPHMPRTGSDFTSFRDCVANSIMLGETIERFEKEYQISFEIKPQEITKEMVNVDAEWIADANQFLDSYISTSPAKSTKTAGAQPDAKQTAKADAMMYAMDRAAFSLQRNPTLDFGKEAQYMFLSHYIDRNEYYWSTEDERLLLDGASMSGENGYLADWLTSSDRQSYNAYLKYSGFNTAMQRLGNLAVDIYSFKDTPADIAKGVESLKKADAVLIAAQGMVLQDPAISIPETMNEEVLPLFTQTRASLSQNPTVKLSEMYDRYMGDEGFMSAYSEPDKSVIVRTSLSIVGAFIIGGPAGALSAAVGAVICESLGFTIDTYMNFFNYAAWVSMRYGFSGRYANRTWYYLMGEEV